MACTGEFADEQLGWYDIVVPQADRLDDEHLEIFDKGGSTLGGELEITASRPDGRVRIQTFENLKERPDEVRAQGCQRSSHLERGRRSW